MSHRQDPAFTALSFEAQTLVENLVSHPDRVDRPSRHVVSALVPSTKARRSLFCADLATEHTLVEMLNFYPDVRIICDSLPLITGLPLNNEFVSVQPSFVVFRGDRVVVYLCNKIAQLRRFNRDHPGFFQRDAEGAWTAPALTTHLGAMGIACEVFTEQSVKPLLFRNLRYLRRYKQHGAQPFAPDRLPAVQTALAGNRSFTLEQLDEQFGDGSPDLVNYCLATKLIFADLERTLIIERDRMVAYSSMSEVEAARRLHALARQAPNPLPAVQALSLTPGSRFALDGVSFVVLEKSPSQVFVENTNDCSRRTFSLSTLCEYARENRVEAIAAPASPESENEALSQLSPRDQAMAVERMNAIQAHLNFRLGRTRLRPQRALSRTGRRWLNAFMDAHSAGRPGISGLYPRTAQRGSNAPKLAEEVRAIVVDCIKELYEQKTAPTKRHVALEIRRRAAAAGCRPPAFETVNRYIAARFSAKQVESRRGRKVAQALLPANLTATEIFFGPQFPQGLAQTDSTQVDVQIVSELGHKVTKRVWLTVLIDVFSGRVLAVWLTVGKPDAGALGELLRIAFQRFQRLPEAILVDNGSEFSNKETEQLVRSLGIEYRFRTSGNPGSGHVVERFFSTITAQFLDNLQGNVKAVKRGDDITEDNNPKNFAVWRLSSFRAALERYCYEVRDTLPTARTGKSPRQIYEEGCRQHGMRFLGVITTSQALEQALMERVGRGMAIYRAGKGFRIAGFAYEPNEQLNAGLDGRSFHVKLNRTDARIAYAYIDSRWVLLRSGVLTEHFSGIGEDRIWALTQELRAAQNLGKSKGKERQDKIADFNAYTRAMVSALDVERALLAAESAKAKAMEKAKADEAVAEAQSGAKESVEEQLDFGVSLGVGIPKPKCPAKEETASNSDDEFSPTSRG